MPLYNSNTGLGTSTGLSQVDMSRTTRAANVSISNAAADRAAHAQAWAAAQDPFSAAGAKERARTMNAAANNTLDPYNEFLLHRRPGYSVAYGPGENPADRARGYGVPGGFQAYMNEQWQKQTGIIKVTDPLSRSDASDFGAQHLVGSAEITLMQAQQTMSELKNRAAIESTAAFNRNVPPAARIDRLAQPENIMERLMPELIQNSKTEIITNKMMTGDLLENPYVNSAQVGMYYNINLQSWVRPKPMNTNTGPPELIQDAFEENMTWRQNMYHGADYKEGPNTKDNTKETIQTIDATGKVITTSIGDNSFKKVKEYDKAATEGALKEKTLQDLMNEKKRSGFLLGSSGTLPPSAAVGTTAGLLGK
jgi:hypothetical protein